MKSLPNGHRALFKTILINLEERSPSLQHHLMHDDTIAAHIYQQFVRRRTNDTANRILNTPANVNPKLNVLLSVSDHHVITFLCNNFI
jgi:hypothetical protein